MSHFPDKIILIGYMASGKTTIGKLLAEKLQKTFIDLDDNIVQKEQQSVPEIFEQKGEVYFRKKEIAFLKEILTGPESFVLSVGGGTPTLTGAVELIKEYGISIYLKAGIETLHKRLLPAVPERPMLSNIAQDLLRDYIAGHLFERNIYYSQANFVIEIDDKTPKEVVDKIYKLILEK